MNGTYRVYGKYSYYGAQVFATGATAHDRLSRAQSGFRIDWTSPTRTTLTLQGDAYTGRSGLFDRPDISRAGGNLLGRLTHTYSPGSQLQFQWYYDGTYRKVPRQFSEHRDTYDLDFQYRFIPFAKNELTAGAGYRLTRGRAAPSPVLFFDPQTRTSPLTNVFVQDEISERSHRASAPPLCGHRHADRPPGRAVSRPVGARIRGQGRVPL